MSRGIGQHRSVEIEINGGLVFDEGVQGRIVFGPYPELYKPVRSRLVHIAVGQQDIVETERQGPGAAQVPGVIMRGCAGAQSGWIEPGRKGIAHFHVKSRIRTGVLEADQVGKFCFGFDPVLGPVAGRKALLVVRVITAPHFLAVDVGKRIGIVQCVLIDHTGGCPAAAAFYGCRWMGWERIFGFLAGLNPLSGTVGRALNEHLLARGKVERAVVQHHMIFGNDVIQHLSGRRTGVFKRKFHHRIAHALRVGDHPGARPAGRLHAKGIGENTCRGAQRLPKLRGIAIYVYPNLKVPAFGEADSTQRKPERVARLSGRGKCGRNKIKLWRQNDLDHGVISPEGPPVAPEYLIHRVEAAAQEGCADRNVEQGTQG